MNDCMVIFPGYFFKHCIKLLGPFACFCTYFSSLWLTKRTECCVFSRRREKRQHTRRSLFAPRTHHVIIVVIRTRLITMEAF